MRVLRSNRIRIALLTLIAMSITATIASAQADPRGASLPPIAAAYAAASTKLSEVTSIEFDWTDASRDNRSVPVKVYFPKNADTASPLIVFSHGLGGSRENYQYISNQWAANGYVVVLPTHVGSDTAILREGSGTLMEKARKAANLENSLARAHDVHFVIDQMLALSDGKIDSPLKGGIDPNRIGVAGHSFGAQTTMLIAGQTIGGKLLEARLKKEPPLPDSRVKAVLAMSEPVPANKTSLDEIYRDVKVPTFFMTGTKDDSPIGDTTADQRRLPFDHTHAATTYLLTLTDADHSIFGGRGADSNLERAEMVKQIRLSSTAFFDAYLKEDTAAKKWLTDDFAEELGNGGVIEQK